MLLLAVGIDIHHKLELVEETKSDVTVKRGTNKSSSLPPAGVAPVKGATGSTKLTKAKSILNKANKKTDDMLVNFHQKCVRVLA